MIKNPQLSLYLTNYNGQISTNVITTSYPYTVVSSETFWTTDYVTKSIPYTVTSVRPHLIRMLSLSKRLINTT